MSSNNVRVVKNHRGSDAGGYTESLDVLDLVPLKERCQCEKTYSGSLLGWQIERAESLQKERKNIENGDDDDDDDYEEKMASRVATATSKEAAKRTTGNRRLVKME